MAASLEHAHLSGFKEIEKEVSPENLSNNDILDFLINFSGVDKDFREDL